MLSWKLPWKLVLALHKEADEPEHVKAPSLLCSHTTIPCLEVPGYNFKSSRSRNSESPEPPPSNKTKRKKLGFKLVAQLVEPESHNKRPQSFPQTVKLGNRVTQRKLISLVSFTETVTTPLADIIFLRFENI